MAPARKSTFPAVEARIVRRWGKHCRRIYGVAHHAQRVHPVYAICIGPGSLTTQAAGQGQILERIAEQAAVDLTLTVFQVDPVERTIEIVQFTVFDRRDTQGVGDLLQLLKHGKPSFVYLPTLKIVDTTSIHQTYKEVAAMHRAHDLHVFAS
jgi:hypothetical protein